MGGRVGAVHAAGQDRHRRRPGPASAPRWAAWSMPKAAPTPRSSPAPATSARQLAGHPGAVGRGRARADHGHRPVGQLVERGGPRTHSPSGAPPRSLSRLAPRRGRRAAAGHSASPGDDEPDALPLGRARGRASGSMPRSRAATSVREPVGVALVAAAAAQTATAPSSATSAGQPGVAGLAEPAQRAPGRRRSSRPVAHRRPAARRAATQQRLAARAAAGRRPPRRQPGRVDARAGRPPSRRAGARGPPPRRLSRAARAAASSSSRVAASAQRPPRASTGAGDVGVEPPVAAGVAGLPGARARRVDPRPDLAAVGSGRASGSRGSCGSHAARRGAGCRSGRRPGR